jgi:hypothetical protein
VPEAPPVEEGGYNDSSSHRARFARVGHGQLNGSVPALAFNFGINGAMSFRVHIVSQLILQSCRRSRLAQQCAAHELLLGCRGLLEVGCRLYWF